MNTIDETLMQTVRAHMQELARLAEEKRNEEEQETARKQKFRDARRAAIRADFLQAQITLVQLLSPNNENSEFRTFVERVLADGETVYGHKPISQVCKLMRQGNLPLKEHVPSLIRELTLWLSKEAADVSLVQLKIVESEFVPSKCAHEYISSNGFEFYDDAYIDSALKQLGQRDSAIKFFVETFGHLISGMS